MPGHDQPLNHHIMEEVSIKIDIANRQYPLKIRKDTEERVKKAASMISERLSDYEKQYAVSDKFDLVAMCLIHFATECVNLSEDAKQEQEQTGEALTAMQSAITDYLKTNSVH